MTATTVSQFLRQQAIKYPNAPIIGYPDDDLNYEVYNLSEINSKADVYAWTYLDIMRSRHIVGFEDGTNKGAVVGLLGPSSLEYLLTAISLARMGYATLFLSTRLSTEVFAYLLNKVGSSTVIVSQSYFKTMQSVKADFIKSLEIIPMLESLPSVIPTQQVRDFEIEHTAEDETRTVWIIHSSGSTGYPKPVQINNSSALANYVSHPAEFSFCTMPLYHAQGLNNFFRAVNAVKPLYLWSASLPLTGKGLITVLQRHEFHTIFAVPYALKLIADTSGGIEELSKLKLVLAAGSACPDELGNTLVRNNVHIVCHYGSTEMGHMMTSARPTDDKDWNYLGVSPRAIPFFQFEEAGSDLYELIVCNGWPAKVMANRPDGSYATSDLFQKHATKQNRWKYIGRRDDTLTLVTGEKINPLEMEGRMKQSKYVSEAVVFGERQTHLGMFIIPSELARGVREDDLMKQINDDLNSMNSTAPNYAHITSDMISILPIDVDVRRTLKSTIIRAAFYNQFQKEITEIYAAYDDERAGVPKQKLAYDELKEFIKCCITNVVPDASGLDDSMDLFNFGLNSLQAIQIRSTIARTVDTSGHVVPQNVVFEHPSIIKLAQYLDSLRHQVNGHSKNGVSDDEVNEKMEGMIEKYSEFKNVSTVFTNGKEKCAIVTGTTGALGAQLLLHLLETTNYIVYCLVRANSRAAATERVKTAVLGQRSQLPADFDRRVIALNSDFSEESLGVDNDILSSIRGSLEHVIHCAWTVNFNWALESFEHANIRGLHNLIALTLGSVQSGKKPVFTFISSIGAVGRFPGELVPEEFISNLSNAQRTGYGQSKMIAEQICNRAALQYGLKLRIMRVGQLAGDSRNGAWNMTEAIPLMIQSVNTLKALPALPEKMSWLPVDIAAQTIIELAFSEDISENEVLHVSHPKLCDWTADVLPALKACGVNFEVIEPADWVELLNHSDTDPAKNPTIKLKEHYNRRYGKGAHYRRKEFETEKTCRLSRILRDAPSVDKALVNKYVVFWRTHGLLD